MQDTIHSGVLEGCQNSFREGFYPIGNVGVCDHAKADSLILSGFWVVFFHGGLILPWHANEKSRLWAAIDVT